MGALVWMPVFVLFTRARFDLDGAILLASLYYLFVVVLEVPSGWLSDRVGRVLTLRLAAASWVVAHTCFTFGNDTFWVIIAGQFFMAVGFASLSGTDVTFHYDTLEALGRAETYQKRQARVAAGGFVATSFAVLAGGALGMADLRLPFVVAIALAALQLGVTFALAEPPRTSTDSDTRRGQILGCLSYLREAPMAWLFLYGIALVTLEHVAVTLLQPWLTEALGRAADDLGATPVWSGVTLAVTAMIGAGAARASAPLSERFGPAPTLLGLAVLSACIVSAMAAWVHPLVLVLVALRSVQVAAAPVIISATIAPRVERRHRATLLSMNSLAGRLGYGLILLFIASSANDNLSGALRTLALIAWVLVLAVVVAARFLHANDLNSQAPHSPTQMSTTR